MYLCEISWYCARSTNSIEKKRTNKAFGTEDLFRDKENNGKTTLAQNLLCSCPNSTRRTHIKNEAKGGRLVIYIPSTHPHILCTFLM